MTSGSRALETETSQKLEFETQLKICMIFKRITSEEGSKEVSPPALTILLLESEILSENLFQRNVYLKVNGTAGGSQGKEVLSRKQLTGRRPVRRL